jgi:hypothetical protein
MAKETAFSDSKKPKFVSQAASEKSATLISLLTLEARRAEIVPGNFGAWQLLKSKCRSF